MAVKQIQLWRVPATPINYAVAYEYISANNKELNLAIQQQLKLNKSLDAFFLQESYQEFIIGKSSLREDIINDVSTLIDKVQSNTQHSSHAITGFIKHIDVNLQQIQSQDKIQSAIAAKQIYQASRLFKQQQNKLLEQLKSTQQNTQKLKLELEEVKKEIYLDPITGLYNRQAMTKHLETWMSEDPHKKIAAIVINIDKFPQIKDRFGPLISDVLLSKVANKVSSYVGESGLPVRSSNNEFLILLPEMQRSTASEIAEKIRQGVDKLRFISSKSGVRLPKMSISLAVNDFKASENIHLVVSKTRHLLSNIVVNPTYKPTTNPY